MARDPSESRSPVLFLQISQQYLSAFDIIWAAAFEGLHPLQWNMPLLLGPVSSLLGASLETATKSVLSGRLEVFPKTHNVSKLKAKLSKPDNNHLADALADYDLPTSVTEANPEIEPRRLQDLFRNPDYHFARLDAFYDRPFASRYPVLGAHSCPDPIALRLLVSAMHMIAKADRKTWAQNSIHWTRNESL